MDQFSLSLSFPPSAFAESPCFESDSDDTSERSSSGVLSEEYVSRMLFPEVPDPPREAALPQVLECLPLAERLRAASVCRLWRQRVLESLSLASGVALQETTHPAQQLLQQLTWLRRTFKKAPGRLKALQLLGRPGAGFPLTRIDLRPYTGLTALSLVPQASFLLSEELLGSLSALSALSALEVGVPRGARGLARPPPEGTLLDPYVHLTGLRSLSVAAAGADVALPPRLTALTRLTQLALTDARSIRPSGAARSPRGGPLAQLLTHLRVLELWAYQDMVPVALVSPTLERAAVRCGTTDPWGGPGPGPDSASPGPAAACCPRLARLALRPTLRPRDLPGLFALTSLQLDKCTAELVGAMGRLRGLASLALAAYRPDRPRSCLAEFAALPALRSLALGLATARGEPAYLFSLGRELGALRALTRLVLRSELTTFLTSGIAHLPSLLVLELGGVLAGGPPLASPTLRKLIVANPPGDAAPPGLPRPDAASLRLGPCPALTSLQFSFAEELPGAFVRDLRVLTSLRTLRLDVRHSSVELCPAADPHGASRLLGALEALPSLRAVQVAAMRSKVGLGALRASRLEHLAIACQDLALKYSLLPSIPSLHLVFDSASGGDVQLLRMSGAIECCVDPGAGYITSGLHEFKLGPPHPLDFPTGSPREHKVFQGLATVAETGYSI